MYSRRDALGVISTSVIACAGCGGSEPTSRSTRTVSDGFGRSVSVPDTVERVVGVGPGALRQIAYLDAADRVVGIEDAEDGWARRVPYNQANPEIRDKPVIGSAGPNAGGNSEAILSVDPDVILYYGDRSRVESLQAQTDTPVVGLEIVDFVGPDSRETMFDTWRLLGDVLGKDGRAERVIEFVRETVGDLQARAEAIPDSKRERAYVGAINYKGAHGIATTRKRFAPFRWTGVENVAGAISTDAASVEISDEQLLRWDPATMFVSASNLGQVREDAAASPEYDTIQAIEEGEVYSILPHASYHHNYGSILANTYFVGRTVYPDRFEDVDLETKTNEIFESMLGTGLYETLLEAYDAFQRLELP